MLPRPAFYRDLERAAAAGRVGHLVVLLDGDLDQARDAIAEWGRRLPAARITAIAQGWMDHTLRPWLDRTDEGSVKLVSLERWSGLDMPPDLFGDLPDLIDRPDAILSVLEHDAFATLAKPALETAVLPLLARWDCPYLVHTPEYEILRACDHARLSRRIEERPQRIAAYRRIVRLVLLVAGALARITPCRGWCAASAWLRPGRG